jgi:two-component system nitrate/nitrite response regulator NarL
MSGVAASARDAASAATAATRSPARVAIVEDHPLYRYALAQLFESEATLSLAGSFGTGEEFLEDLEAIDVDVALVDLDLPGLDGLAVLRHASAQKPDLRVIVLTACSEAASVFAALETGAVGYLVKDIDHQALLRAITAVVRGEAVLPRRLQGGMIDQIRARAGGDVPRLTEREQQILALLAEGYKSPAMAKKLHLAVGTIKSHLGVIYEKLDVGDRAAAVAVGLRLGLLR